MSQGITWTCESPVKHWTANKTYLKCLKYMDNILKSIIIFISISVLPCSQLTPTNPLLQLHLWVAYVEFIHTRWHSPRLQHGLSAQGPDFAARTINTPGFNVCGMQNSKNVKDDINRTCMTIGQCLGSNTCRKSHPGFRLVPFRRPWITEMHHVTLYSFIWGPPCRIHTVSGRKIVSYPYGLQQCPDR